MLYYYVYVNFIVCKNIGFSLIQKLPYFNVQGILRRKIILIARVTMFGIHSWSLFVDKKFFYCMGLTMVFVAHSKNIRFPVNHIKLI